MRYERFKDCPECEGTGVPWCPHCLGAGEIRTPAEHTEMWAVFSEGSPFLLALSKDSAWKLATQLFQDNKASLLELDYTCEQIDVIRREP